MIFSVRNFITFEECAKLIDFCDQFAVIGYGNRPMLSVHALRGEDALWLRDLSLKCKDALEAGLDTPELLVESLFVTCLPTGDSHIPHADNEKNENGNWVPNHTPQRDYTAILYLNDNFTGGELVFPDLGKSIIPEPGLLVGFPCNHEYVHAVPKVTSGKRYSVPMWFIKK